MSVTDEILARPPLLHLEDIERDIGNMIHLSHQRQPSVHIVPKAVRPLPEEMPSDVEHRDGVNLVGQLSVEAVVRDFAGAVKETEALGHELQDAARKCEAMMKGAHAMVVEIKQLAATYREQGKRHFLQIENSSLMTTEVRDVCGTLKEKIAAGNSAG